MISVAAQSRRETARVVQRAQLALPAAAGQTNVASGQHATATEPGRPHCASRLHDHAGLHGYAAKRQELDRRFFAWPP